MSENENGMIELELDWEALAVAFENQLPNSHSYLELSTGKVHTQNVAPGAPPQPPDPAEDFLYIQPRPSREGYRTMQRFIETVSEPRLKEALSAALVGKGAFRRFKDQLLDYPEVRQQWFAFKDAEVYSYIRDWLAREGVKATNQPPAGTIKERINNSQPPPPVETRRELRPVPVELPGSDNEWKAAIADYDRPDVVFRPAKAALLVVDMQKVFASEEGSTFLPMSVPVSERLAALVQECRQSGVPVIFTRHVHTDPQMDGGSMARWWSSLILEGSEEAELIDSLRPRDGERVIVKCRYSAFAGTPLEMILRSLGVEDLIVGGVMTNLCCETTARDAFNRDFNVFFLGDGTATANRELHDSSLKNISYGFGRVLGVSEALEILRGQGLRRQ
jgi:nicotinamidase-related amidase